MILASSGYFHFSGHLHNSGFVGLACTVACGVKVPGTNDAVAISRNANVGGTTSILDSRDEDWAIERNDSNVLVNWERLRDTASMSATIKAGLGAEEIITLILLPALGALTAISVLGGGVGPDTHCRTTDGMHAVKDGNNRTVFEPDGIRCSP